MEFVWLYYKFKVLIKPNAFRAHTKLSQHIKSLGFAYLFYKNDKLPLEVPDANRDGKTRWFFISLRYRGADRSFCNIQRKTPLLSSWKEISGWNLNGKKIYDLILNTNPFNMKKVFNVDRKGIRIFKAPYKCSTTIHLSIEMSSFNFV